MKTAVLQTRLDTRSFPDPAPLPNFDCLARVYRWMEWLTFGPLLSRSRCRFLPMVRGTTPRQALIIGDGDGRFTARLLTENPGMNVDAVDASRAMLAQLQRNARPDASRIALHCADARSWCPASPRYDLIVTHFFLDCLTSDDVSDLAMRLKPCISPEALWIVSDFAVPQSRYGQWFAKPLVSLLYFAFRILTGLNVRRLPDHRRALHQAGFALTQVHNSLSGLLVSELWKPL